MTRFLSLTVTALTLSGLAGAAPGVARAATAGSSAASPVNTAPPTVAGSAQQGQTLTASTGSWSGDAPISYTFTWQRCNGSGGSCGDISGATAQTYVVTSSDVGGTLRIVVAAANSAGHGSAASSPTGTVVAAETPPSVSKQPDPHGTAQVGQTVTVDNGSWHGTTPLTYTYQWQRCSTSGTCTSISGATKSSYVPVTGDVGFRLRATVTAKNNAGSASIASNTTAAVTQAAAPVNITKPSINATSTRVGSAVVGSIGSWSGTQPISYSLTWNRCDTSGGHCQTIANASAQTYTLTAVDAGSTLELVVRGSNSAGSSVAVSAPTRIVTSDPPGAIRLPSGKVSIPASSVSLPDRMVIASVRFSRHPLRSRHAFTARIRVTDTHGYLVRDALVHALGIPYGWVAGAREVATGVDGYAVVTLRPTAKLPLRKGSALVLSIRARKPGDSTLAGVSAHRLVQLQLAAPRG